IILITIDTTRADRMGFLGSDRGLTPNLDALAKQSIVFTHAYAQAPLTTPSHATMLTGTYPQMHHIEDLGTPLAAGLPYLPDMLHANGYHTAAFVGAEILDADTLAAGFDRGFDLYDGHFHQKAAGEDRYKSVERRAEDVANRAMGWLSQNQQGPFFIWMHFYDPHEPYDPPEPFKSHFADSPYDGEIAYADSVVGSILEVLVRHGFFENCAIAIAADHGEAFGEHGEEHHGIFLYDETIHVPFLLKLPRERLAGTRVDEKVPLAAIAPTLLQTAGIAVPASMQARSLLVLAEPSKDEESSARKRTREQPVYSETNYNRRTFGWAMLRSWRTGNYLYVQAPKRELYDQATDPGANHNIAGASPAIAGALQAQLQEFWDKTSGGEAASPKLDPSQEEKLHALGYLPASDSSTAHDSAEVDPKDKTEVLNRFHRALTSKDEDRYDDAIAGFQDVIRMEPNLGGAYLELGGVFAIRNRYDEAIPILRKAVEKMPDSGSAHFQLGLALVRMKQWDAALPEMQAAVACTPGAFLFHLDLASVLVQQRRIPEAKVEYEKALDIKPNNFEVNFFYGRLLLQQGRANMALPRLTRAVRSNPDSADAHVFLAEAYEKLGRLKEANQERAKAAQLKSQPPG
ncbi:MAG: sulfatase-like hydrolase/transferase, partial [Terriglobales bacterium]